MHEQLNEMMVYGDLGTLFLHDVRYDPEDRAYCNPLADGRVQFRLQTETGFEQADLVYNDGSLRLQPLELYAQDGRFRYWQTTIRPEAPQFTYSFAFKLTGGRSYYLSGRGVTHAVETPFTLDLAQVRPFETPDWMKGTVMYQIFPERFASGDAATTPANAVAWGAPPHPAEFQGGDLHGIVAHLDHLEKLGVEVIYLNPINSSPSNHKYDATDFYRVDPAFGGNAALHALVEALHRRGMKIILDASFNHCYPQFFAFQDVVKRGAQSPYRDWFTIHDFPVRVRYRPHLLTDAMRQSPRYQHLLARLERFRRHSDVPVEIVDDDGPITEPTYLAWYNVISMPKFNHHNPETRAYFLDVAQYWLREFDIDGWRMDVAQFVEDVFWREFRTACKAIRPDCHLLSEIWGDTSHWLQGDMFDATMNYLFRDLCLDYFAKETLTTAALLTGLTRLDALYAPQVTAVQQNLLSSHDVARFLHLAGEDKRKFRPATFLQLTLPGAPSIYYGDEIGMTGGRDPDNRRAFPWDRPDTWDEDLFAYVRDLIALRRRSPALRRGDWRVIWAEGDAFAFERRHAEERLVAIISRHDNRERVKIPYPDASSADVISGGAAVSVEDGSLVLSPIRPWSGTLIALV